MRQRRMAIGGALAFLLVVVGWILWMLHSAESVRSMSKPPRSHRSDSTAQASSMDSMIRECPGDMVFVPAATGVHFGCWDRLVNDLHTVDIHAFCIDRTEMTVSRYRACERAGRCAGPECAQRGDDFPIVCITAEDAEAACSFEGKRLPTADEFEYAARGSEGRSYPWVEDVDLSADAARPGEILAVGTRVWDVSPLGIHDLALNANEWTSSPGQPIVVRWPDEMVVDASSGGVNKRKRMVMSWIYRTVACSFIPIDALVTSPNRGARCVIDSKKDDQ